jgi:hypothetical protein
MTREKKPKVVMVPSPIEKGLVDAATSENQHREQIQPGRGENDPDPGGNAALHRLQ